MPQTTSCINLHREKDSDMDDLTEAFGSSFGGGHRVINKPASTEPHSSSSTSAASVESPPTTTMRMVLRSADGRTRISDLPTTRISRSRRVDVPPEQHIESTSFLDKFICWIKGSEAPPKEFQRALREHDKNQLAILKQENKWLWDANQKQELEIKEHESELQQQHEDDHAKLVQSTVEWKNAFDAEHANVKALEKQLKVAKKETECANEVAEASKKGLDATKKASEAVKKDASGFQGRAEIAEKICREYEVQIKSLKAKVMSLQADKFRSVEPSERRGMKTDEIEKQLKSLQAEIREWAATYSMIEIEEVLKPECFAKVTQQLKARNCIVSATVLQSCLLDSPAMQKQGAASSMLLTATVSFDIMQKVIGDPFFAFTGRPEERGILLPRTHATAFVEIMDLVEDSDEAGAEAFRYQLMRLLEPLDSNQSPAANELRTQVQISRQTAISKLVLAITDDTIMGDMSEEDLKDAVAELEDIVQNAAELSRQLWTRKARIEVWDFQKLIQPGGPHPQYVSTSPLFEPHSAHNRTLAQDPQALEGDRIVLMCHPSMITSGDLEGQNYGDRKVLSKATVWMG
ncbi:hypothetical protein Slin15195_G040670 [Septoria linicola]|uniref:Uncharacterized protein n=1 Tax=Septoria linicola TaxID=215465 RepID=A0A9Q9EIW1_9PEZI|nr:hypothetical protein Slin14017_G044200 [Septoria linicola]USW50748.1 hypothetical protein Slin15195_G040670 [Septoria linicola]